MSPSDICYVNNYCSQLFDVETNLSGFQNDKPVIPDIDIQINNFKSVTKVRYFKHEYR